jgi:hypothetical protein
MPINSLLIKKKPGRKNEPVFDDITNKPMIEFRFKVKEVNYRCLLLV